MLKGSREEQRNFEVTEAAAAAAAAAGQGDERQEKLNEASAEVDRLMRLNLFHRLGLNETASAQDVNRVVKRRLMETAKKYESDLAMWYPDGALVYSRLMSAYIQCKDMIANENVTEQETTPRLRQLAGRTYPVGTQYRQIYLDLLHRWGMARHDEIVETIDNDKLTALTTTTEAAAADTAAAAAAAAAAAGQGDVRQAKLNEARAEVDRLMPLNLFQRLGLTETASAQEANREVKRRIFETAKKYEPDLAMWYPDGAVVYSRLLAAYIQCKDMIANENVTEQETTPRLRQLTLRTYPVGTPYRQIYLDLLQRLDMARHDEIVKTIENDKLTGASAGGKGKRKLYTHRRNRKQPKRALSRRIRKYRSAKAKSNRSRKGRR